MLKTCLTTLLFLFFYPICAQQTAMDVSTDDDLLSAYDYLYNNPISLNLCTKEDLSQIQFLTPNQIEAFLHFRTLNGPFIHQFELQVIPGWDLSVCRKISPFVYVEPATTKSFAIQPSFALIRIEQTVEKAQGFIQTGKSTTYLGNRFKQFMRIKNNQHPVLQYGAIAQKDAGEANNIDFVSGYLQLSPKKYVQRMILGDFTLQWGQGLVQAGGFNLGKNYESIKSTQRFHLGGQPYTSSSEYSYNRGMYLNTLLSQHIQWQGFISNKWLDGKIYQINEKEGFRSLDTDGYHRTATELANQNTIQEFKWGHSISMKVGQKNQIQVNLVSTQYSPEKIPTTLVYKNQDWAGKQFYLWSLSQSTQFRNARMIYELAYQNTQKVSIIHGVALSASKVLDFSYLLRYFASGFYNPDGRAFGENTKNENEIGLFLGNQWQIQKRKRLSSYVDFFYFPHIKYQVSQEKTYGWEILARYQSEKKNKLLFFNQLKWTSKQEDATKYSLQRTHDVQETADFRFLFTRKWQLHSRVAIHGLYKDQASYLGYLLVQDMQVNLPNLQIGARLAYFRSPNYDTRLYAFEQGLPYSFGLVNYNGHAIRMAALLEYKANPKLQLALKIGRTQYFDRQVIGSGTDAIAANHKTDLSLQLVYQNL